ncbi:hypothetical protein [Lysobacter claricitrinus]|uniref:hypothetical protein n=1 Tax=Lysobacter claricitrinus TaxID=3367728 RepID=UPI0038B36F55
MVGYLRVDDVDRAIAAGLLDIDACAGCAPTCTAALLSARDDRRFALAARERFRAREQRLARRAAEREAARTTPPAASATTAKPTLPPAAAAALQRALARAKGPSQ